MAEPGHVREHISLQRGQELVERRGLLGRHSRETRVQLGRVGRVDNRSGWAGDALDEHVDGAVAELSHRLDVERERRVVPPWHGATLIHDPLRRR
jgi:hypothetical protein